MFSWSPLQTKFVHIIDASLHLYTLLHDATNLVVDRVQVGAVWRPQISSDEVAVLCCSAEWSHGRDGPAH